MGDRYIINPYLSESTMAYAHSLRFITQGFSMMPMKELISAGVFIKVGAEVKKETYKIGDKFKIVQPSDGNWPPCGHCGEDKLLLASYAILRKVDQSEEKRVDLLDGNSCGVHGGFWIRKDPFEKYISDGLFILMDNKCASSVPRPPPGLDNRKNSGSCSHCGTQTIRYESWSSVTQICPVCKA